MGAREEQNERRRQDILDASLSLFVEKGYAGTTVRDISDFIGTSNGLLFHYFKTKDEMIGALATHAMESVGYVAKILASDSSPLAIFEKITEAIFQAYRTEHGRNLFLLVNQIKTQASIPPTVKRLVASIDTIDLSVPIIRKGQLEGVFKEGDALSLSMTYWGAVQGIGEVLGWYPDAPLPEGEHVLDILRK